MVKLLIKGFTVTWNQDGAGVDHAVVDLFRVNCQAKELVEARCTYIGQQGRFEMLTPAGLEGRSL